MHYLKRARQVARASIGTPHRFVPGLRALATFQTVLSLAFLPGPARADEEDLVSDRPSFTSSCLVVVPGHTQFEGGATFMSRSGVKTLSGPEFLLRYGVLRRLEVRLALPDYVRRSARGNTTERLGDAALGLKFQVGPPSGSWGAALLPQLTSPADKDAPGDVAPEFTLAVSSELPWGGSTGGGLGYAFHEGAGRGPDLLTASFLIAHGISHSLQGFLEWGAERPDEGATRHVLHNGYMLAVPPDGQLDFHFGVGSTEGARDIFVGLGFTVRH